MSFSFGFGGDDLDEDGTEPPAANAQELLVKDTQATTPPRKWTLTELLPLLPSQISYNTLQISSRYDHETHNISIPRRALFDIRAQLMAEANSDENDNDKLLAGLDAGDLTSGLYEGGFKTWECAVDLAEEAAKLRFEGNWHVVELGAGSAIPSLTLLQNALKGNSVDQKIHITLCDYNEDVLKLCTMPNVVLNCLIRNPGSDHEDHDIDLEAASPNLLEDLEQQLKRSGVTVDFVSGAWGADLVNLLHQSSQDREPENVLILASETIYSPESIEVFASTIMELLKRARGSASALIASKNIYFGVGGGVQEFIRAVRELGGLSKIRQEHVGGVGRTMLEVTRPP